MDKKRVAVFLLVVAIISLFFYLDLRSYLTLEALKAHREALDTFYAEHRLLTVFVFMALYIVQTALALPGAIIFSLSAGILFGTFMGTVYAVTAATAGAVLAFLVTRYLFHQTVQKKFGPQLDKLNARLEKDGLHYLLFLRLVPVFPFFLINLAAALTRLPLRTFVLGTLIGIIPGGFAFVNAGASLATINHVGDIASPRVLGALAFLGIFALVPVFYQRLKNRRPVGSRLEG
jgi:uncharacterized membrane protein YdjX (TVP38/TMEM64 family)